MRAAFATLAFAALAAAVPQAVTSAIAPSSSPPPGCSENFNGAFIITPVDSNSSSSSSSSKKRNTPLNITLKGGILTDSDGRTGYVASNQQFQFDKPPQAGAIYTAGFSVCPNGHLAIGNDETWFKCLSGTFFNLYLHNDAGQCSEIWLQVTGVNGGTPAPASGSTTSAATTTLVASSSAGVNASAPIATMSTASGPVNGTMSASASGNGTMTVTTGTAGATTSGAGQTTSTASGTQLPTGGPTSAETAASAASTASSASSKAGAAALPTARSEVFGLVAGLLAMAVL